MPTDPLSEAREALRDALSYHGNREVRARKLVNAAAVLARLDALPAPERWTRDVDFNGPAEHGWLYRDPDGGDDAGFVEIARCPEHGLHGDRHDCYVCGGPVERVRMRPVEGGMEGANHATTEDIDAR